MPACAGTDGGSSEHGSYSLIKHPSVIARVVENSFPFVPAEAGTQALTRYPALGPDARWRGHERRERTCELSDSNFRQRNSNSQATSPVLFERGRVRLEVFAPQRRGEEERRTAP